MVDATLQTLYRIVLAECLATVNRQKETEKNGKE